MSRRFTPLSTAVAVATASLIVAVAGCASSRTSEEPAGLSRDADTTPTLAEATPTNPLDATSQPNAVDAVAMPAETPAPAAPVASIEPQPAAQPISEATPPATDVSAAPMPAQTPQPSTPAYPSDMTTSSTTTDTPASNNADQALPPRRDRH